MCTPATIVCTLTPGDLTRRRAWIGKLPREAPRAHRRDNLALNLKFARTSVDRVRQEQECCAILIFDLREDVDAMRLTAAEEAHDAADMVYDQFATSHPRGVGSLDCLRALMFPISSRGRPRKAGGGRYV